MGGGQFLDFMGGPSCYEEEHRAHGGSPSPPTKENPGHCVNFHTIGYVLISFKES